MKGIIAFLMLGAFAFPAHAQDRVDLANVDTNLRLDIQSAATPVVTEKYEYYQIKGESERELRAQMSQNGTKWPDGQTYDSLTTWNIHWDYDYNCGAQGCSVEGFNSNVDITFRYPQWADPDTAPEALRNKWDGYMKNLVLHENGHRDMAVQATAELARAVSALPPAPNRTELDRQVKALSTELMAKLDKDEKDYDAVTIHGTTQGAVFP